MPDRCNAPFLCEGDYDAALADPRLMEALAVKYDIVNLGGVPPRSQA